MSRHIGRWPVVARQCIFADCENPQATVNPSVVELKRNGMLRLISGRAVYCEQSPSVYPTTANALARPRNALYISKMQFEWDTEKDAKNQAKHGISFREASAVFGDPLALTVPDPDHSAGEDRFVTTGYTDQRRLVIVAHTDRGGRIRILSARQVTRRERKFYEEK